MKNKIKIFNSHKKGVLVYDPKCHLTLLSCEPQRVYPHLRAMKEHELDWREQESFPDGRTSGSGIGHMLTKSFNIPSIFVCCTKLLISDHSSCLVVYHDTEVLSCSCGLAYLVFNYYSGTMVSIRFFVLILISVLLKATERYDQPIRHWQCAWYFTTV